MARTVNYQNRADKIKKLIDEKGISDNVEFPGWVRGDTKDKLLRKADVFFLPSYNEGMPMSVLDAMGYGLPVVSTNVGGIPKIVHDGENGYCCDPGDVNRFAKGITEILLDRKERKSFGQTGNKSGGKGKEAAVSVSDGDGASERSERAGRSGKTGGKRDPGRHADAAGR